MHIAFELALGTPKASGSSGMLKALNREPVYGTETCFATVPAWHLRIRRGQCQAYFWLPGCCLKKLAQCRVLDLPGGLVKGCLRRIVRRGDLSCDSCNGLN
jgi:hypothetical protein